MMRSMPLYNIRVCIVLCCNEDSPPMEADHKGRNIVERMEGRMLIRFQMIEIIWYVF